MTLPATFLAKTRTSDCLIWTGAVNTKGYGCIAIDGKSELAHRVAYESEHGPIPEGLTIDHLCRVRNCVRVDHLEAVTVAENLRRARRRLAVGGECRHGHLIAAEADLYERPSGALECIACIRSRKLDTEAAAS